MKIAQQSGGNCVARGLSTMRLALGYRTLFPKGMGLTGTQSPHDVLFSAKYWFPRHEVKVWCGKEQAGDAPPDEYQGEYCPADFDCDHHLVGFSYFNVGAEEAHFVIGVPALYGDMKSGIMIAVGDVTPHSDETEEG